MGQYIRTDKKKGKTYYWLVESHRDGEKVVQKRIRYLGTQKPDLATAKRGNAFSSKSVARKQEKVTVENKPAPQPVHTNEEDDLSWLLG